MDATGRAVRPRALSIAGSDSGGGAGIQADLKTFSALGVFGMTAITAVTVQNTQGVSGYQALSPAIVADQIRAVVTDIGVDAAKTGMLASAEIVEAVATAVLETAVPNLVVDPVAVSKHGDRLLDEAAVGALRDRILPLATLVTPNLPEAASLAGFPVTSGDLMEDAAEAIRAMGPVAVLVKGGHLTGSSGADDLFFDGDRMEWIAGERIDDDRTRTEPGCTLSSSIAAYLARGDELLDAVRKGKVFVTEAIRAALPLGHGIGPVDQLWGIGKALSHRPPAGEPSDEVECQARRSGLAEPEGCVLGRLNGAFDLAGLQAARADVQALGRPVHERADALHVGVPPLGGAAVRVGDLHAEERLLPADVADGGHGPTRVADHLSDPGARSRRSLARRRDQRGSDVVSPTAGWACSPAKISSARDRRSGERGRRAARGSGSHRGAPIPVSSWWS